jgi:hypothetical protein
MNIKPRALMIAAGVGLVVQVVISLIGSAMSIGPALAGGGPSQIGQFSGIASAISVLLCLCALAVDTAVGFLYVYLSSREGTVSMGDAALGGAATGLAARVVSGAIGACIGLLLVPLILSQMATGVPPEMAGVMLGAGVAGGLIGAIGGICIGLIIGGVFGAIGGAIGGATVGKSGSAAPAM